MISLLTEPLPGTFYGAPILLLGFIQPKDHLLVLFIETDGKIQTGPMDGLIVEWRYDVNAQSWRYTYADAQNIGGEEVQGNLWDLDGGDGGDEDSPGHLDDGDVDTSGESLRPDTEGA